MKKFDVLGCILYGILCLCIVWAIGEIVVTCLSSPWDSTNLQPSTHPVILPHTVPPREEPPVEPHIVPEEPHIVPHVVP